MATEPIPRPAARVLLFTPERDVLLLKHRDSPTTAFWVAPGGGVDPGESPEDAARRELLEETGLEVSLTGPIWDRRMTFEWQGVVYRGEELYFFGAVEFPVVVTLPSENYESHILLDQKWWTIDELRSTAETVYPLELATLLTTFDFDDPPSTLLLLED